MDVCDAARSAKQYVTGLVDGEPIGNVGLADIKFGTRSSAKPQRLCIAADALIEGEQAHLRRQVAHKDGSGKVDGIQRADGFVGKPPARAFDHLRIDAADRPVGCGGFKGRACAGGRCFVEFASDGCAVQHPVAFDKGEIRCIDGLCLDECLVGLFTPMLVEQPGKHGTGFDVQVHGFQSPRVSRNIERSLS